MVEYGAPARFPCRLCGSEDLRLYYTLGNDAQFRYYQCPHCNLVNYDLETGLDQTQYTDEFIDPTDDGARRNRDKDQSFAFLSRFASPPGQFLDIGCGTGRLLHVAQRAGWTVKGLELSPEMAERVAELLDVEIMAGDFLDMEPPSEDLGRFDVVCLRHVIEHLPDPLRTMSSISRLLRRGGLLLLEMPNVEAWSKRWNRALVRAGLHQRQFPADMQAGHCNEYCRESMDYLARRTGFSLLRWETYSSKPAVNWLLSRLPVGTKARALLRYGS